jgi:hypothetical protein
VFEGALVVVPPVVGTSEIASFTIINSLLDGNTEGYAFIGSDIVSLEFTGSSFTNSAGVHITGGSVADHHINESLFTNNSHNMDVDEGCEGTFDAELNWWGSSEGPGETVSGDVDFEPWAINEWWMNLLPGEQCFGMGEIPFDCNQLDFGSGEDECSCSEIEGAEMDESGNCYCPEGP